MYSDGGPSTGRLDSPSAHVGADKRAPLLSENKLGAIPLAALTAEEHAKNNLPDILSRWQQREGCSFTVLNLDDTVCLLAITSPGSFVLGLLFEDAALVRMRFRKHGAAGSSHIMRLSAPLRSQSPA